LIADKSKEKNIAADEIKIEVTKNGPYIVTGKVPVFEQIIIVDTDGIPVEWGKGKEYPAREKCGLCRCGQTENKPYCDGSHIKAAFDGTEAADFEPFLKKAKIIEGPELNLADAEDLCASARFCSARCASRSARSLSTAAFNWAIYALMSISCGDRAASNLYNSFCLTRRPCCRCAEWVFAHFAHF